MATVKITIEAVSIANKNAKLIDKFALFAGASLDEQFKQIDLNKGRFDATGGLKHSLFYGVVAEKGTEFKVELEVGNLLIKKLNGRVPKDSGTPGHSAGHIYFTP